MMIDGAGDADRSAGGVNAVDYRPLILASCSTMTVLAMLMVAARIYTRALITRSTDRDDYTIWLAMALSCAGFAVVGAEVRSGAGLPAYYLSPENLRQSLLLQFITQTLFLWSIMFVKVSIVFCLLRFAPSKTFARFLWGCLIFFVISATVYFLVIMLQCQPLGMLWDSSILGHCISPLTTRAFAYANNAISLTVDLLLATLPIPMIWKIQVEMHVKVIIGFVMGLGALAAAACAIRIHFLSPETSTNDPILDTIAWTIWTTVECNIAIIAASVPSVIPLVKKLIHSAKIYTNAVSNAPRSCQGAMEDLEQGRPEATGSGANNTEVVHVEKITRTLVEGEISEPDIEDEDILQMYANVSRNIAKA